MSKGQIHALAQRKHAVPHLMMKTNRNVVVTTLSNQSEAFASDLGDDQSRYLFL